MTLKIEFEKPMFFSALSGTPGAFLSTWTSLHIYI